jgi:hypothetical protein
LRELLPISESAANHQRISRCDCNYKNRHVASQAASKIMLCLEIQYHCGNSKIVISRLRADRLATPLARVPNGQKIKIAQV